MLVYLQSVIPLKSQLLDESLREFSSFVKRCLIASDGAEIGIALTESGARGNSGLAESLPADTNRFSLNWYPRADPLTAQEFLREITRQKPKKTSSQLRLNGASIAKVEILLQRLADSLPSSGRGIMLLLHLNGWRIVGDESGPAVDASFSRFRHGARKLGASLTLRFQALSLKDPVVAATNRAASQSLGLRFGKPMAAFANAAVIPSVAAPPLKPDVRLQPPSPTEQVIVLQTFDEALARAAEQIGAQPEDLNSIPLLSSRFESAKKRMDDVAAGKKEKIDLPSRLKQFMKECFPEYCFDAADAEQIWFRKTVDSTLDLLLMFNKVYQWRLGKSFTIEFGVDFPNTKFGGMHTGWSGTRTNFFRIFHRDWEQPTWAYATSKELIAALYGCDMLLRRVLPALEDQCRKLLLPPPAELPSGIEQRGALSAREAYEHVLQHVREWASDVVLEDISSGNVLEQSDGVSSGITRDGRLYPEGTWLFKFLSKELDLYCLYRIPHTGRIYWNYYPVPQGGIPKYSSVLATDRWIDSTAIAQRAFEKIEEQLDGFRTWRFWLTLHDPKRYSGEFVWNAQCIATGLKKSRRDISAQFNPITGDFIKVERR